MNINNFIIEIQGLYGQYNSFQRKHVEGWLSTVKADLLPVLLRQVIESVSWTHNKRPPGLAEFNTALKEIRKNGTEAYQVYEHPQIGEDILQGEEAAEKLKEIFEPLVKKMNIKFTGGEDETN